MRLLHHIPKSCKRVLVRVDLNVPVKEGHILDNARLKACQKTIDFLCQRGHQVALLTHFGRPNGWEKGLSTAFLTKPLENLFHRDVVFVPDCQGEKVSAGLARHDNKVLLLENSRFYPQEMACDESFIGQLVRPFDAFVQEAFSVCHRHHASVTGIPRYVPSFAGAALTQELALLETLFQDPCRPIGVIVGGAKISTKMSLLKHMAQFADHLFVAGGIANTLMASMGMEVGSSLWEKEALADARDLREICHKTGCTLHLPVDFQGYQDSTPIVFTPKDMSEDHTILDIGPKTLQTWYDTLKTCKTGIWNGPLGWFEKPPFDQGTLSLAQKLATLSTLDMIAGGGETHAVLKQAQCLKAFKHVSLSGGAFLAFLEGKSLPGIQALKASPAMDG